MSKTVLELHEKFASVREELLERFGLGGTHSDCVHIVERTKVPWVFSEPYGTVWCAPELPKADATREQIANWMPRATYMSLLTHTATGAPAMWEQDGTVAVLYAHRNGTDLMVLMLLNSELRGPDSLGETIHELALQEGPAVMPIGTKIPVNKKPETLH